MEDEPNRSGATFADLGLNPTILDALAKSGYETPTELQRAMIAPFLEGHDLVVRARRGQGKTLGYLLPILNQVDLADGTQAIIVSPTRELAIQISAECRKLLGNQGLRSVALHPGADVEPQAALAENVQVISGTPGRLLDVLERQIVNAKTIRFVVFDELDRLLNSGHLEPMRRLMNELAHGRQLIWVSAGVDEEIQLLADKYLVEPMRIGYERPEEKLGTPVHELVLGPQRQQIGLLIERIRAAQPAATIVITSRRDDVRRICEGLRRAGLTVMSMDEEASKLAHRGARSGRAHPPAKPERQEAVVWVGSEMVTRAIDLPHVALLALFGPPPGVETYADYVCRPVRLAAALRRVVTLVEPGQRKRMEDMYAAAGLTVQVHEIEVLEEEPEEESGRPAPLERMDRDRGGRGDRGEGRGERGGRERRDRRGGRDRDRGGPGRGRDRDRPDRGERDRRERGGEPADGSYRSPAELAAAVAGASASPPAEPKSPMHARLEEAKAAGYVTDTKSRDFPVIPLRYVLPVTARPGKGGLPDYPPPKTLGSRFRTSRRGSRKGPEEKQQD
jgi:ATP-dependent RNA helicase DeaD